MPDLKVSDCTSNVRNENLVQNTSKSSLQILFYNIFQYFDFKSLKLVNENKNYEKSKILFHVHT